MIEVKFDNTLKLPAIVMPLYNETPDNDPIAGTSGSGAQTKMDGIFAPLFRLNNITIPFQQVVSMELSGGIVPRLNVVINDTLSLSKTLDTPTNDNYIQLQILPQFDGAYKKINLLFYMTSCEIQGQNIYIEAIYSVPQLWDTSMDAFGKLSSYQFFENIARKLNLGFCSNMTNTSDERYIYSSNTNLVTLMEREIEYSGDNEHVYDVWVDWWNNINLVDVYNEYKLVEKDENMMVWIYPTDYNVSNDTDTQTPIEVVATIGNAPNLMNTQLYTPTYTPISSSSMVTDQVIEIFKLEDRTTENIVVMDGDIKNDIFKSYVYYGENVGDYNYLYQKATREMFLNKMNGQCIEVKLNRPMLGIVRGSKVNFIFYDINKYTSQGTQAEETIESNIPLPDDIIAEDTRYVVNRTVSGQYYVIDSSISYAGSMWTHTLRLGRYADKVNKYIE